MHIIQHWNKLLPPASPILNRELLHRGGEDRKKDLIMSGDLDWELQCFISRARVQTQATGRGGGMHTAECDLPHIGSLVAHVKRISKSSYSSYFKKNLNIYPFISQLGKRNSCVVPVGMAVRSCTFSVGHTLERAVMAAPGSNTPQGGGEWESPSSPQIFTLFLSCSPLQSADIPRKIHGLLNSKRAENKGLLQLAKEMEYFAQVSIWSCSSQNCLCWPDPVLPKRCGPDPS